MPGPAELCRRDRILDAAERAFADAGFAGASMRTIVKGARVNLATVYYYFGSKEGLMEAVLRRRFGPLRQDQLDGLRARQEAAGRTPLAVEAILEALLQPALHVALSVPHQRLAVARLIGRIAAEPDAQTQAFLRSQNTPMRQAFLEALHESLPEVPLIYLRWRLEFVSGALAFVLCNPHKLEAEGHAVPVDAQEVLGEMVGFFAAGFSPLTAQRTAQSAGRTSKPHRGKANAPLRRRADPNPRPLAAKS